ncbi:unnamed protein product [Acanthosepion pharaonis]|uniref:PDZ domain-containing protein n=1 Tax=Acanthosepion pharaonis TaxID=158019 RepID=A0A812BKW4_ACAPH|nr:unnamed protein product [Sepia pharaonis]
MVITKTANHTFSFSSDRASSFVLSYPVLYDGQWTPQLLLRQSLPVVTRVPKVNRPMGTSCSGRSGFFCDKHIETKEEKEKRLRKKYGNIPLQEVIIYKTMPTLGLAFEGGATSRQMLPRVVSIQSNGSTFHSHTALQVGSILLEVNNSSLVGIQHSEVAASIANAFLDETSDYMKFLITEPGWEIKIGTK